MAEKIDRYYEVWWKTSRSTPIAYVPKDVPTHHLIEMMQNLDEFPFDFELHEVTIKKTIEKGEITDGPCDYQCNALVMPLMSSRMKEIIESELKGTEHVRWLRACINGKTESYQYYVPMFCKKLDTLNRENTRYTDEEKEWIIQPCYRKDAIQKYAMFHGPRSNWQLTSDIYFNNEIRKKLKKAGITGVRFTDCWAD